MRSDLSDERNDIQIEFTESSDTSGFYEITNSTLKNHIRNSRVGDQQEETHLQSGNQEEEDFGNDNHLQVLQDSSTNLRRTSRRTQPVSYFSISRVFKTLIWKF